MTDLLIQSIVVDIDRLVRFVCRRRIRHADLRAAALRVLTQADVPSLHLLIDGALTRGAYDRATMRLCLRLENALDLIEDHQPVILAAIKTPTDTRLVRRHLRRTWDGRYDLGPWNPPTVRPDHATGDSEPETDTHG